MKTLYLLRHAKSSGTAVTHRDFDRRLDQSGRDAARLDGNVLAKEKLTNVLVISSPSVRTRETLEIVLAVNSINVEVRFDSQVYDAELPALLSVLRGIEDQQTVVLLVGHNPGMERLVRFLTGEIRALAAGALVKINISDGSWNTLPASGSTLEWLFNPSA